MKKYYILKISYTEISKSKNRKGIEKAKDSVIKGGNIAKNAKEIRKLNSGEMS